MPVTPRVRNQDLRIWLLPHEASALEQAVRLANTTKSKAVRKLIRDWCSLVLGRVVEERET